MTYCKLGETPTVKYAFAGGTQRIYKSEYSPIDVSIKSVPLDGTGNSNPVGYGLGFIPGNGNGSFFWYNVTDHIIFEIPRSVPDAFGYLPRIALKYCGQYSFPRVSPCDGISRYTNCYQTLILTGNLSVDPNRKCPTSDKNRCSIEVSYNGLVIFQDQGDCPCTFSVQCGDCAEDELKCETPGYPGYCCIKCSEIVTEIQQMTALVKTL